MAHTAYTFRYRVRNWRAYNQALIARGELSSRSTKPRTHDLAKHHGSQWVWGTQDLLGYGDTMRGGPQERLRSELASRPRLRVRGDESYAARSAGAEQHDLSATRITHSPDLFIIN